MPKQEEIRKLLSQGTSSAEIIQQGYARGTVYKVARQFAKDGDPESANPEFDATVPQPTPAPWTTSLSADPDILHLQKEIQLARLENELSNIRGEVMTIEQIQGQLARLQEWSVSMTRSLSEAIGQMAGYEVDLEAAEAFEREALAELRSQ